MAAYFQRLAKRSGGKAPPSGGGAFPAIGSGGAFGANPGVGLGSHPVQPAGHPIRNAGMPGGGLEMPLPAETQGLASLGHGQMPSAYPSPLAREAGARLAHASPGETPRGDLPLAGSEASLSASGFDPPFGFPDLTRRMEGIGEGLPVGGYPPPSGEGSGAELGKGLRLGEPSYLEARGSAGERPTRGDGPLTEAHADALSGRTGRIGAAASMDSGNREPGRASSGREIGDQGGEARASATASETAEIRWSRPLRTSITLESGLGADSANPKASLRPEDGFASNLPPAVSSAHGPVHVRIGQVSVEIRQPAPAVPPPPMPPPPVPRRAQASVPQAAPPVSTFRASRHYLKG